MRDDDELRPVGEAAQELDEAPDVRVVERGLDLVQEVEGARPGEEEREEERDRAERLLAAGEEREPRDALAGRAGARPRCPAPRPRPPRSRRAGPRRPGRASRDLGEVLLDRRVASPRSAARRSRSARRGASRARRASARGPRAAPVSSASRSFSRSCSSAASGLTWPSCSRRALQPGDLGAQLVRLLVGERLALGVLGEPARRSPRARRSSRARFDLHLREPLGRLGRLAAELGLARAEARQLVRRASPERLPPASTRAAGAAARSAAPHSAAALEQPRVDLLGDASARVFSGTVRTGRALRLGARREPASRRRSATSTASRFSLRAVSTSARAPRAHRRRGVGCPARARPSRPGRSDGGASAERQSRARRASARSVARGLGRRARGAARARSTALRSR